ncbi:Protein of unknown function [Pilibacter termitis]|uniref:Uncharacterized protein n=1 Tax=Pilibacter termitis TaxID=263852 RepID=A0A1T4K8Q9_9ENTE|nr:DUF4059 family protein [Pilibacter termitis]SJZ38715.1 Protein of unknown function [Pilibacter termitis]
MEQLVDIYLQSLLIAILFEFVLTIIGLPFAALHKFKTMPTAKSYLTEMLLINILTSPILAFSILAFTFILKVRNLA